MNKDIIIEPEKYDFFYNIVDSHERKSIEARKTNTNK